MADYKASKEAFVSNMTGSSITHVNLISLVALASIALYSALQTRLPPSKSIPVIPAYIILVLPLLLSMTFFADSPLQLSIFLLIPTGLLLCVSARDFSSLPNSTLQKERDDRSNEALPIEPLPALTTYRAHMMLMTILAILAVDFPVFPRSLAKCETFGVSLMDLGVGSFVFSQGVVSAIPILKNPRYLETPVWRKLPTILWKMFPVIFLGLVRVVLVKGVEYPEHVSEYGVHWNFFITLALLPVLQVLLHPLILHLPVSLVALSVAIVHQMSLSWLGLEGFVLFTPRTGLISSNKEGIVSLAGYLSIHLLGLSIGTLILPPSPNYFRRYQSQRNKSNVPSPTATGRQNDKTATELCSYAVVWWTLLGLGKLFGVGTNVSRQMANLQYVLWIAAFNTSFIFGYFLLDLYFFPLPSSKSVYSPTSKLKVPTTSLSLSTKQLGNPPPLLEAINKNGLVLFLLANVATGLINLSMQTMYASNLSAFFILCGYSFVICYVSWIFRGRRLVKL